MMLPAAGVIESRSSSQGRNSPPVDRISPLPDSLLCHILSLLQTKAAVATSVLSTRWKRVWTGVTALEFHCSGDADDPNWNFVPFVHRVLLHHDAGSIQKFHLRWHGSGCIEVFNLNPWVCFAISRNARSLIVELNLGHLSDFSPLEIPAALFVSGTLQVLQLNFFTRAVEFLLKIPSVVCLPKLEVLKLDYLAYESNESVVRLISGCPVLRSLHIRWEGQVLVGPMVDFKICSSSLRDLTLYVHPCPGNLTYQGYDRRLEIDAPNLDHLFLQDYALKEFSVTRFHTLSTATLVFSGDMWSFKRRVSELCVARCNSVVMLVEAMSSVKHLELRGPVIEALHHATTSLSTCFERLTKLTVDLKCCSWSSLGGLLSHSIKLQVLEIEMDFCGSDTHKLCWKDPGQVPECLSTSLTHITYNYLQGRKTEMAMLRYILKHGAVLKSVNVVYVTHNWLHVQKKIAKFPKLSVDCSIEFT